MKTRSMKFCGWDILLFNHLFTQQTFRALCLHENTNMKEATEFFPLGHSHACQRTKESNEQLVQNSKAQGGFTGYAEHTRTGQPGRWLGVLWGKGMHGNHLGVQESTITSKGNIEAQILCLEEGTSHHQIWPLQSADCTRATTRLEPGQFFSSHRMTKLKELFIVKLKTQVLNLPCWAMLPEKQAEKGNLERERNEHTDPRSPHPTASREGEGWFSSPQI